MSTNVPTCPGPDAIEELAQRPPGPGDTSHAALVAHVARCPECAERLRAARFANRFSRVLLGEAEAVEHGAVLPVIPGYRVEREISRGAQGVVYEAVQIKSGQRVAVKLLHERGHASPTSGARFVREIQIAGALSHPGIVRLLDSMVLADGSDALIMERIDGVALSLWLQGSPRPSRDQIVGILASVADALHHAHQRGVIHRDLKPTNILIDENGTARVLDFGIARWTDASRDAQRVTLTGEFAGTLAYAAPEQVGEQRSGADIRSDVYSLGVIAFEALTGAMPYGVHGSLESTIWNIVHAEPARSTTHGLGRDLETVLAKAIAKEPDRRYQTAAELARDLRHALHGEAIDARRDSRIYVLRKSLRRHRFAVAFAGMLACFAAVMLVVLAVSNARLTDALRESRIERLRTLAATGSRAKAETILWKELAAAERGVPSEAMQGVWSGKRELRRCVWAFMELQGTARCISRRSMGIDPASRVLPVGRDRIAVIQGRMVDVRTILGVPVTKSVQLAEHAVFLAATPDAHHILLYRDGAVESWAMQDGSLKGPIGRYLIHDRGGEVPVTEARDGVAVVSTTSSTPVILSIPELNVRADLTEGALNQRVWISDESEFVHYLGRDGTLREVDAADGHERWRRDFVSAAELEPPTALAVGVRIVSNPARTRAVVMLHSSTVVLDLAEHGQVMRLDARGGVRAGAVINPEGTLIALGSFGDSRSRLFDARTLAELPSLTGHDRTVGVQSFTSDGTRITTIDSAYDLRVWDAPGHGWREELTPATPNALDPALSRDASRLYFGTSQRRLAVIDLTEKGHPPRQLSESLALTVACAPDGNAVASAALGPTLTLMDGDGGKLRTLEAAPGEKIQSIRFNPTGELVAFGTMEGTVALVSVRDSKVERRVAISPLAKVASVRFVGTTGLLAVGARDGRVHIFDAATLDPVRTVEVSDKQVRSIGVSPDAQSVAAVGDAGQILLLNAKTGRVRASPRVSEDAIFCVAFHPQGETILVGDRAGVVTVVDVATLTVLATFDMHAPVTSITFEGGGDRVIVSAIGHAMERWDFAALAGTMRAVRPATLPE